MPSLHRSRNQGSGESPAAAALRCRVCKPTPAPARVPCGRYHARIELRPCGWKTAVAWLETQPVVDHRRGPGTPRRERGSARDRFRGRCIACQPPRRARPVGRVSVPRPGAANEALLSPNGPAEIIAAPRSSEHCRGVGHVLDAVHRRYGRGPLLPPTVLPKSSSQGRWVLLRPCLVLQKFCFRFSVTSNL